MPKHDFGFWRIFGVLGGFMVSSESVAPVRFIWVRYQPELTLPVPSRGHFRVFRPDFGLSEACILPSEQPHCVLATQNLAWPHCGLATVSLSGNHTARVCGRGGRADGTGHA